MEGMGKAAVMNRVNAPLDLMEFPLPKVERDCVLVKILCCTICGSDLHSWLGHRPSPIPIILGHEVMGEIVELGNGTMRDSGDKPIRVGDRITWNESDTCGKCYYCREKNLMMKCPYLKKFGHDSCAEPPHFFGGFAEYAYITPGTCVIKVPDNLENEEASLASCAMATTVAAWEHIGIELGDNVLIQGSGALAFVASAYAKTKGANRIIVTSALEHRLQFIKNFGATDTIITKKKTNEEIVRRVKDLTDGRGVDVAMEASGSRGRVEQGLPSLRIGGRYVMVGNVCPGENFSYESSDIIFRWLTIKGVHMYDTKHLQIGVDFLARTKNVFPFRELITHRVALDDITKGLRIAESGRAIRVAVLP
jgi:putative phosphonate catabolism associated alcohol dehydrogenase